MTKLERIERMEKDLAKLKAEVEPQFKIGSFGKFWDKNYSRYVWDYLKSINNNENLPYERSAGFFWRNFEPGLPKGVNQDGSPK